MPIETKNDLLRNRVLISRSATSQAPLPGESDVLVEVFTG
jgi:hypothetical protein